MTPLDATFADLLRRHGKPVILVANKAEGKAGDSGALEALSRMSRTGASRLMVVDEDRLLGILSLKDLLRFFSLKMELEEAGKG